LQKEIIINETSVPIIEEGGMWYPISFIGNRVLLKDLSPSQLRQNGYGKYIREFEVNFGEGIGGIQNTYCISEDGLKVILGNSKIGRLSVEQKKAMNGVLGYLGEELIIDLKEKLKDFITEEELNQHDFWSKECIDVFIKEFEGEIIWQKCNKCNKYYPYHKNFWVKEVNKNNKQPLRTICNSCEGLHVEYLNNKEFTKAYYDGGEELYNIYKYDNKNIYKVYELYLAGKIDHYPSLLSNSLNAINIINKLYKEIILQNLDKCNQEYLSDITKIPIEYISMKSVDKYFFKKLKNKDILKSNLGEKNKKIIQKMTFEDAVELINMYLQNNNIKIEDVYTYDYDTLLKESKAYWYVVNIEKDKLGFIMKYFNNEYGAYKFKSVTGQKYWQSRDNADQAMKYLIEKDMGLAVEKIPLYITKYGVRKKSGILYEMIRRKRFDSSLFEWINRLYPDKFIEEDFDIGIIRNIFDSMEEGIIDEMLRKEFKTVIYNNRNSKNKITVKNMNPDWIILTDINIYIVEYFGIALEQQQYNTRIKYYINKTKNKMEKYRTLPYGEKIYLYPDDIKGDCKGFKEKIKLII
jgi:hypothetical protein